MHDLLNIDSMLEAGVHFGHRKSLWNPQMLPYLYGISRNGTHVIDLSKSLCMLKFAMQSVKDVASKGGRILFVGTKVQSTKIIEEQAIRCGQYYINSSWPAGLLTNWRSVSGSIKKIGHYEKFLSNEDVLAGLKKREILRVKRKYEKILKTFCGIKNMGGYPDILFVLDTNREKVAITEANKLGIPVAAVVDTNSDPRNIQYPIPGNDDSVKSIEYFCSIIADAVLLGMESGLKKDELLKKGDIKTTEDVASSLMDKKYPEGTNQPESQG
ncbi:30S ribosomal protein S2 [Anaplasmataceae bacterium AB001_6]|nr:30S ribosomal protein S2 [Anaplasmataceae bacterium AB001_6]